MILTFLRRNAKLHFRTTSPLSSDSSILKPLVEHAHWRAKEERFDCWPQLLEPQLELTSIKRQQILRGFDSI